MDSEALERGEKLKAAIEKAKADWLENRNKCIALLEKFCLEFPKYIGHVSAVEFKVGVQKPTNWETAKAALGSDKGDVAVEMHLHNFCGLKFKVSEPVCVSIVDDLATITAFDLRKRGKTGTHFETDLSRFFDEIIRLLPERYLSIEPPRTSGPPTGVRARVIE